MWSGAGKKRGVEMCIAGSALGEKGVGDSKKKKAKGVVAVVAMEKLKNLERCSLLLKKKCVSINNLQCLLF